MGKGIVYEVGGGMRAVDMIRDRLKRIGMTQTELAEKLGINPCNLSKKLGSDRTIRASELFAALDVMGLSATFADKEGRIADGPRKGASPHVSMMVDGTRYDTAKADMLCRTEELGGGWVLELYRDFYGRYFVAHRCKYEGVKPLITPYPESSARGFYGMFKGPGDLSLEDVFGNGA